MEEKKETKVTKVARAADSLSLGISMVVAVAIGTGLGIWLKQYWGNWALFGGIALGIFAAVNNVYKAYKAQKASYDELGDTHFAVPPQNKDDEIDELKNI